MCFYHDCDWYAGEQHVETGPAPKRTRCEECDCVIHPGEVREYIFLQEHGACRICHDGDPDGCDNEDHESHLPPGATCPDGCDYGESFEYNRCEPCLRVLEAIKAVEVAAGCLGSETQPGIGGLRVAMCNEGDEYVDVALEMYPTLANHLWRLTREYDPEAGWSQADLEPVEVYGGEG